MVPLLCLLIKGRPLRNVLKSLIRSREARSRGTRVAQFIRAEKGLEIGDPGLVEFVYRGPGGTPAHPAKEGLKNR